VKKPITSQIEKDYAILVATSMNEDQLYECVVSSIRKRLAGTTTQAVSKEIANSEWAYLLERES